MKVEYKKTETRTMDIPVPSFWKGNLDFIYVYAKDGKFLADQATNISSYSAVIIGSNGHNLNFDELIPIEQAEYEAALDKAILNIEKSVNRLCPQPDAVIHLSRQIIQAKNN